MTVRGITLAELIDDILSAVEEHGIFGPANRLRAIQPQLCAVVAQVETWRQGLPDGMPIRERGGRGARLADLADALSRAASEANVNLDDQVRP